MYDNHSFNTHNKYNNKLHKLSRQLINQINQIQRILQRLINPSWSINYNKDNLKMKIKLNNKTSTLTNHNNKMDQKVNYITNSKIIYFYYI